MFVQEEQQTKREQRSIRNWSSKLVEGIKGDIVEKNETEREPTN